MKTEAAYTSEVLGHLRKLRPNWYVVKVNDRTTAGILDAHFCYRQEADYIGQTCHLEFKKSRALRPNIDTLLTPAQKRTCLKFHTLEVPYHILVRTPETWKVYNVHGFELDLTPSSKETAAWLCQ